MKNALACLVALYLLTGCLPPIPTLVPTAPVTTQIPVAVASRIPPTVTAVPPTATLIPPTPTHVSLAAIDLDSVIVKPSDLVSEHDPQSGIFESAPQSDNSIEQQL